LCRVCRVLPRTSQTASTTTCTRLFKFCCPKRDANGSSRPLPSTTRSACSRHPDSRRRFPVVPERVGQVSQSTSCARHVQAPLALLTAATASHPKGRFRTFMDTRRQASCGRPWTEDTRRLPGRLCPAANRNWAFWFQREYCRRSR
jgi:hypothetical protein